MAKTASGRKPPPVEYRFRKGKSGNPRGPRILNKLSPPPEDQRGGFLVVPATLTAEEWMAQAEKRNAEARDPRSPTRRTKNSTPRSLFFRKIKRWSTQRSRKQETACRPRLERLC